MLNRGKRLARHALIVALYPQALSRKQPVRKREIERIVVIRPDHIGDLLFTTPALARLRKAFPGAHITGLAAPWSGGVWAGSPSLNSTRTIPFPGIANNEGPPLKPYILMGKVARSVEHGRYDLGIVLRSDHWWGAALLAAARVPRRWGYDTPGTQRWLNVTQPYVPGRHEVEQNLHLVEAVIRAEAMPSRLQRLGPLHINREAGEPPLSPLSPSPCDAVPAEWLNSPHRLIIHPGTGAANKLWFIDRWAQVADRLTTEGWSVMLTGSPSERELAARIESAATCKLHNIAGRTRNLQELTWALGQAQMVLGVDSGPLHIAAALNKPSLHLYGPSDELIWGPWGDPNLHRTLRAPGTSPAARLEVMSKELQGGPEMQAITVDMVMHQVRQLGQ